MYISNNYNTVDSAFQGRLMALPPWAQEGREKTAILQDSRLIEALGIEPVTEIKKVESGYLVVTDKSEMLVDVKYLPSAVPGMCAPARFELEFHPPVSIGTV